MRIKQADVIPNVNCMNRMKVGGCLFLIRFRLVVTYFSLCKKSQIVVTHFVDTYSRRIGRRIDHIPQETLSALCSYQWPGNIRELQNLIERAVILSDDGVLPNPLPTAGTESVKAAPAPTTLRDSEHTLILRTLEAVGWVIGGPKGAASRLGLKRTTLIHKMKKLGISRPPLESGADVPGPVPWGADAQLQL